MLCQCLKNAGMKGLVDEICLDDSVREMSLNFLWHVLFCRATLEAILQKTLEELKLKKSFKTLVKVSELEVQQQNEEAELISAEERNVKEINILHNILEGDFKKGMDKINNKSDTIAWLKVRIINVMFLHVHA